MIATRGLVVVRVSPFGWSTRVHARAVLVTLSLVGAAFGMSAAIFQRLAENPLASPDIIGVNAGAAASAVFAIVMLDLGGLSVTLAALGGAAVTSLGIYALAYKRGVTGYRLVLVGIGVTAVLTSVTQYLLTRAQIFEAQRAMVWLTGSLNGRGWEHVRPVALALAAVGTASAGPIGFAALVSPQIARRLVGGRSLALLPAAATGALLLVSADLVGRRVFAPTELPVGVITAIVGAPYLLYLLARANKIGSGR